MASEFRTLMQRAEALDKRRMERIELQRKSIDRLSNKVERVRRLALAGETVASSEILAALEGD